MSKSFHPRVLVQGAVIIAPDGKLHSPMYTKFDSGQHLLSLNRWELNREGLEAALDYAQKHPMENTYKEVNFDISNLVVTGPMKRVADPEGAIIKYFGVQRNETTENLAKEYLKFLSDHIAGVKIKTDITRQLATIRIQEIRDNPDAFLDTIKSQMVQLEMSGVRRRMQHAADRAAPYGVGAKLRKRWQATPAIPEKKGRALVDTLTADMKKLDQNTTILLEHYEPIIFIGDNIHYFDGNQTTHESGGLGTGRIEGCKGLADAEANAIFMHRSQIGQKDASTLFEETRHLIHDRVLGENGEGNDFKERVGNAFLKDIGKPDSLNYVDK